ncbi:ABC transporter ATP-binding protein [Candidatus Poriferisocius sp.]|uniref:ABC transporter ATP-binding protein n=1 Tax=Candidatus Poriferisocius sp. TaxID=3101276 RepID=UPI003B5B3005
MANDQDQAEHAVWLRGIEKQFPGVIACAGAELRVRPGTIHALLGENGAGKTTLVNVLAGVYRPDAGEVWVGGWRRHFQSPADAIAAGVGMVYQEFRLVPTLTVAENVVLGAAPALLRSSEIEDQVAELSAAYGMAADPDQPIWQLSMGERQRVEILKALWRNASVLVMDEPTAVLTPGEAAELGVTLRAMADDGRSVVYISHKLDEVVAFCDEATVLRRGKTVGTVEHLAAEDRGELAELMVGSTTGGYVDRPPPAEAGPEVLALSGVHALSDRGLPALRDVDLTVRSGEIVGIAGVSGNGQKELAEVIAGLRQPTEGGVALRHDDITRASPGARYRLGLAYVPEDRLGVGLAPKMSVVDNAVVRSYLAQRRGIMLVMAQCLQFCRALVERFGVRVGRLNDPIAGLSGGNLQRLLLGRELAEEPAVLVAAQPTRGLDVQGVAAIQSHLVAQRADGVGVLLISEDLDELLALSDRLLVMYEGRVVAELDPDDTTRGQVGAAMAGQAQP